MRVWWLLGWVVELYAHELVVAVAQSTPIETISTDQLRRLYLGQNFRLEGSKVYLLHLPTDHPLRLEFEERLLHVDRVQINQAWLQALYQGHHPPKVLKTQESVAEFLTKMEGTIGYMDDEVAIRYHLKIVWRE